MSNWTKNGLLGSLKQAVQTRINIHLKTNQTLIDVRHSLRIRSLRAFLNDESLLPYLGSYLFFLITIVASEIILKQINASPLFTWSENDDVRKLLIDVTSYLLAAQVTAIGLVFPIAIGLVTLIVQREDASSTASEIQVYYHETLAYRVGASGIALSIILAIQLVWPVHFFVHQLGYGSSDQVFKIFITAVHIFWLAVNLTALWHFLLTSLSFIRPQERALLRKQFAAKVAIPRSLQHHLIQNYYAEAASLILQEQGRFNNGTPKIQVYFGSDFDWGTPEIIAHQPNSRVLVDVWMRPLGYVVRCWALRTKKLQAQDSLDPQTQDSLGAILTFTPTPLLELPSSGILCRRRGGAPLRAYEKLVLKNCFRYQNIK